MRNVLKYARPVKGFGSSKRTVSTKLIRQAVRKAADVSTNDRREFEKSIAHSLPAPFPPSLPMYFKFMRQITALDFSQRLLREDYLHFNPDLIHTPFTAELEVIDNGPYNYQASYGFWRFATDRHFAVRGFKNGEPQGETFHPSPDFEFDVYMCHNPIVHPALVERNGQGLVTARGISQESLKQWKRLVMQQRDEAFTQLIGAFQCAYPGVNCWSYTLCDNSERLMRTSPGVEVKDGLAYIYSGGVQ